MNIFIFGLGYSAGFFARTRAARHTFAATVTTREKARALAAEGQTAFVFSLDETEDALRQHLARADAIIASAPPDDGRDPVLAAFAEDIARSERAKTLIYLSTIGVYGDHLGAWVDEASPCRPVNARSQWRLDAENAWRELGARTGKTVHILRLAGIYGPGNNALVNLRRGVARRIVKAGQVFNRIHVEDIARAIEACLSHPGGVWNIADDAPAPAEDVVTFAAELMGVEPPPLVKFEDAKLSPMAASFYVEVKRASNVAMKEKLGVTLAYPTYREGIRALFEAGEGRA